MGKRPAIQKKKWRLFNERIYSLKLSLRLGKRLEKLLELFVSLMSKMLN